jgi:hypothetical protein
MSTRLNININDETAATLRDLAQERGTSVTDIVRRAVSVYAYVEDQLADKSKELQFRDRETDEVTKLALV